MPSNTTIVAGIEIPSTSPIFLTIVGVDVLLGLACVKFAPSSSGDEPFEPT